MMKQTLLTIALAVGCCSVMYAQTDTVAVKEKKTEHIIGVQGNELIRQVFNFNNTTASSVNNPYLLSYTLRFINSGIGIRAGIGYNSSSNSQSDGITSTTSNINDMQLRLGVEKAFRLSKKWSTGVGIDALLNTNDDKTLTSTFSFDTTVSNVKSTIVTYGGGVMGWLRYNITERILVGTEASFYYTTGKNKQVITTTTPQFQPQTGGNENVTTTTPVNNTVSQGLFSSPVVFFLMIRF